MAGIFDSFLDALHLNSEYPEPDVNEEEDFEEEEPPKKKKAPVNNNDTEILPEAQKPTVKVKPSRSSNKVVPMRHSTSSAGFMGVCVIKPTNVDNDTREIADTLLAGSAVIINLEALDVSTAQRIVDFTAGACSAIDGNLKPISDCVFIATPKTVDISGDFQGILDNISNAGSNSRQKVSALITPDF